MSSTATDTQTESPLVFSDNAAQKVRALIKEEGNDELKLVSPSMKMSPKMIPWSKTVM